MKHRYGAFLAIGLAVLGGWGMTIAQSGGGSSKPEVKIRPGTFANAEQGMSIVVSAAKDGLFTVSGYQVIGGAKKEIRGNISRTGALRASIVDSRNTPINGRYQARDDAIFIQSIDGQPAGILLKRMGGRGVKEGTYSAREKSPNGAWEVKITKSSGPDYNLNGTLEIGGKKVGVSGTVKENGRVIGRAGSEGQLFLSGAYDFGNNTIELIASATKSGAGLSAVLKPGPLKAGSTGTFGLVSKVVGNIPGPADGNDSVITGDITESSFSVSIKMKPPYQGEASIKHEFSSQLGPTLRPGDEIELTVISSASKSGRDAPGLAGTGTWWVEGDGADVSQVGKQFIGTASDGKFYANGTASTKFKVLSKGTIKITAVYTGGYWGPAGNFNWNPCTYIYKFGEKPIPPGK